MSERIQKILANTGLGSRRELEGWIAEGLVKVNGQLAKLGDRADVDDNLTVKGRFYRVVDEQGTRHRVLMYHKPLGQVTTRHDPEGRKTVFDDLPRLRTGRWIAVGRLDINTLGLLLLTDDGDLANRLMHPSAEVEREYAIRVNGQVSDDVLARLSEGVELDDGPARFDKVWFDGGDGSNQWYRAIVREGRNREVRRLWESQGLQVSRLIRVRYGPVVLPKRLHRGKFDSVPDHLIAELDRVAQPKHRAGNGGDSVDGHKEAVKPVRANLKVVPVHPRAKRKARQRSRRR